MISGVKTFYTGTNRNSFRPNEAAEVIGVEWVMTDSEVGRPCFRVQYADGVNDLCPICDSDNYALAPAEKVHRLKHPNLSDHDWLQIEQAARGCVSGTSDEWPHLVKAIQKITGHQLTRKSATWLQGFCQGILA